MRKPRIEIRVLCVLQKVKMYIPFVFYHRGMNIYKLYSREINDCLFFKIVYERKLILNVEQEDKSITSAVIQSEIET